VAVRGALTAVLFDLDNTLVDRDGARDRVIRAWLGEEALSWVRPLDDGGRSDRRAFCQAVVARAPELGDADAFWERFRLGVADAVEPDPEVVRAVELLQGHFRLGVVTNGGPAQRTKLARAGLAGLLPRVWVSSEVGADKPDPRVFRAALDGLGVEPHEALFVGDDLVRDIEGARAVGMQAVWVGGDRARGYPTLASVSALPHQLGILSSSPSP
jgi:HAD superfamily hydrolase (TIGR01509 family)